MVSKKLLDKSICAVGLPLAEAFSEHMRTIGYRLAPKNIIGLTGSNSKPELIDERAMIETSTVEQSGVCYRTL